jgi:Restriction endonuclease
MTHQCLSSPYLSNTLHFSGEVDNTIESSDCGPVQTVFAREYCEANRIARFLRSMQLYHAAYGYFVTTSTFTPESLHVIATNRQPIHAIDGFKLESLLRTRTREIALAWKEILDTLAQ